MNVNLTIFEGYMRCAKILLLEGKPEKALEIYAYGLKMLPSQHPRREVGTCCRGSPFFTFV